MALGPGLMTVATHWRHAEAHNRAAGNIRLRSLRHKRRCNFE
jgi:hypothetical protein